jgi:hypothetical protein
VVESREDGDLDAKEGSSAMASMSGTRSDDAMANGGSSVDDLATDGDA